MTTSSLFTRTLACAVFGAALNVSAQTTPGDQNVSLKQEIQLAISRGLTFLKSTQNKETGSWSTPEEPALTALPLTAMIGDVTRGPSDPVSADVKLGYDFLLKNIKPDGGIYAKGRANYNTSICLMALVVNPQPQYDEAIRNARKFIIGQQNDFDEKGKTDNAFDGGVGYGSHEPAHADLSNTHFAIEALYYSKKLLEDQGKPVDKDHDLNWSAAIKFVERCQNRPESNDQPWAGTNPKDYGGFIYEPGTSKIAPEKLPDGRVALRSCGSMTYAGMMSFIYAGLTPDDPRVKAALKWLGENYTLDENPGLGAEGMFYYFHTMSRALGVAGVDTLTTKDGKNVNWRQELAHKLLNVQGGDGSWKNGTAARWMEGDPNLVTAYTCLALEHVYRSLR